jgi:hypothetical protein
MAVIIAASAHPTQELCAALHTNHMQYTAIGHTVSKEKQKSATSL